MPRMLRARSLSALALLAGALAACGGGEAKVSGPEEAARAAAAVLFTEPAGQSLVLDMADLKFSAKSIAVKPGEVVEVVLANRGSIEHDFSIASLPGEKAFRVGGKDTDVARGKNEVHAHLNAGERGIVRLKATVPGTYEYFCTVPGHKEAGMKGTLTVQ